MSRKSLFPQSRRHIWVYDQDWEFLEKAFGARLGVGPAIRNILHIYVGNLKDRAQAQLDAAQSQKGETK